MNMKTKWNKKEGQWYVTQVTKVDEMGLVLQKYCDLLIHYVSFFKKLECTSQHDNESHVVFNYAHTCNN